MKLFPRIRPKAPEPESDIWANGTWTDDTVVAWVEEPDWHWFTRCDRCGSREVWLYDVHREAFQGFQWVCGRCLIQTITHKLEQKTRELVQVTTDGPAIAPELLDSAREAAARNWI